MSGSKMLKAPRLVTEATFGAPLALCEREAIQLAAAEWRNVEFTHNDHVYVVSIGRMLESIQRYSADSSSNTDPQP